MGRIDDSLLSVESIADGTERSLQLAGLLSTLFKIKGVVLVVTGQLAFDSYANAASNKPELDLAIFSGKMTPRSLLEVMRGQLHAKGSINHWKVAGIPIRFQGEAIIVNRDLCRDFTTEHGVVKLFPVEELTAEYILAAHYPEPDFEAQTRARLLLINGLTDAFQMNWPALQQLCHRTEYRIGEELAQMRMSAKKDVDAIGAGTDQTGQVPVPAEESAAPDGGETSSGQVVDDVVN